MSHAGAAPTWLLGPGTRSTAVTDHVATMVDLDDRDLMARLWAAQRESGADGALELLLRGGIVAIPDFVLIEVEGTTYRVVVRGKATVVAQTDGETVSYEGANVRLVAEHLISAPAMVAAGFVGTLPDLGALTRSEVGDNDEPAVAAEFAMTSGFGFFDWIARSRASYINSMPQPQPASFPADVTDTVGDSAASVPSITPDDPRPSPPATPTHPAPSRAPDEHGRHDDHRLAAPATGGDAMVDPEVADPEAAAEDAGDQSDVAATGDAAVESQQAAPTGDDDPDAEVGSDARYASIFGETVQRSVIDAAIREGDDDDGGEAGLSDSVPEGGSGTAGDQPSVDQPPMLTEHTIPGDRLETAGDETVPPVRADLDGHTMPPVEDLAHTRPPMAAEVQLGDHDGHTISRADLPSTGSTQWEWGTEAPGDVGADGSAGPYVQSVRCADGHDNPPHRSDCARCQQPLDAEPVSVARPPLGTLTFSTGDEIALDRPVLVGRKPDIAGLAVSEIPRELALEVGDGLSRSHALFSIAGWQVRVEDLGSTNHTTIRLPEQPPQRLRVGEPVPIVSGTLIDLGGEVTCRYDFNT